MTTAINFNGSSVYAMGSDAANALAIGGNATCLYTGGVSVGYSSSVTGNDGVAIGISSEASTGAVAVGRSAVASSENSIAIGYSSDAVATGAIAIGTYAFASGERSVAVGHVAKAYGTGSIAIGRYAIANGANAIAIGYSITATTGQTAIRNIFGKSGGGSQVFVTANGKLNTNSSSIKTKHNIRDLEAIDIQQSAFQPLRFIFLADNSESIGHIADEMAKVMPEICPTDKEGNPANIRYDLLSVILLRKIRDLRQRLEALSTV